MKKKACEHPFDDERPWGNYEVLYADLDAGYQVKRVEINPKSRLSLQKHLKRVEIWTVVEGEGIATVGDREIPVKKGSVIETPKDTIHRMANTGTTPLVFIEVQRGDYLGEDDIIRIEDDYNRI
ncbi:MAG: phosphomannose isomerase type II C-terminal cupin domain [Candidatus Omnitrophica bacterium]|nr:phosphomannose isomerase type II C-terminal cupin domain [Candidatus Omnitrophota bacterium]